MNQEIASSPITIKGIRDGLLISIDRYRSFAELFSALQDEVGSKGSFLRNSRVALEVGGQILSLTDLTELQSFFASHGMALWAILSRREATREAARELGLATRLPGSTMDLQGNGNPNPAPTPAANQAQLPPNALLIKETLRSGRYIYYEGHIVIVGDINPGAEVVAEGDIIVWGKLRGLVHAGAAGEKKSTISALDLSPTQLRIAHHIAITPPLDKQRVIIPETALLREEQIVAVPWK